MKFLNLSITKNPEDKYTIYINPWSIIITCRLGFWFLKYGKIISIKAVYDKEFPGFEFHFVIPGVWFYIRKNFKGTSEMLDDLVESVSGKTHNINELF